MKSSYAMSSGKQDTNSKIWRSALYIRLSREDEGEKEESFSITSQREILKEYVRQHDDIEIFDIYADDGYSGTNFERPDFKRMMRDIEKGLVNCVIVKDLSRFCRNAVDGGYYLDNVFTKLQIRFISVNNCLDTYSSSMNASTRCITVGVQNVINESVAATTSVNVRGTLNIAREKGQFIGSFPSYGYLKDPSNYHNLIIDPEAAEVVRKIFDLFLNGKSVIGIAKELNSMGIVNPTMYKKMKGFKYNHPSSHVNDGLWPDSSVRRILKNEIYTGNMVQGKNTAISYKIKKCRAVPQKDWIIVENTHEAIISKEDFLKAQSLFSGHVRTSPKNYEADLFAGLVKCSVCQRHMNKKTSCHSYGTYKYYRCSSIRKLNSSSCCKNSIRTDKLEHIVLKTLQNLADTALSAERILSKIKENPEVKNRQNRLSLSLESLNGEKEKLSDAVSDLYPDWKAGILSKEEYILTKERLSQKISSLDEKIKSLNNSIESMDKNLNGNLFLESFKKYGKITHLTRKAVTELVDEISVSPDGQIEISFKFRDAYKDALMFIDEKDENRPA